MRLVQRGRRGRKKKSRRKTIKTIPTVLQGVAFASPDARLEALASFHDIALSDGEAVRLSVAIFVQAAVWWLDQLSPL